MEEKTLDSKIIYEGKILNLRVDKVTLPNGRKTQREIVEHLGSVAILPLIGNNQILFVQQYRKPIEKILLEIPAGRVEKGESLEDCAKRELAEEIGYKAEHLEELASVYLAPGYSSEIIHIFQAKKLKKSRPNPDEDEIIKVVTLNKQEALDRIINGEIKDSKTIIAILLYLRLEKDLSSCNNI